MPYPGDCSESWARFHDCSGNDVDALRPFGLNDHHGFDIEQPARSLLGRGIRCTGSIRWEAFESHDKHELSTKPQSADA